VLDDGISSGDVVVCFFGAVLWRGGWLSCGGLRGGYGFHCRLRIGIGRARCTTEKLSPPLFDLGEVNSGEECEVEVCC
jgi:hypothetical protein